MRKYSVLKMEKQIYRKELLRLQSIESRDQMINEIVGTVIDDVEPEILGTYDSMEEAKNVTPFSISIDRYSRNIPYYLVSVNGIIQEYEADEDGEFISGSDYDWFGNISEEEFERIKDM